MDEVHMRGLNEIAGSLVDEPSATVGILSNANRDGPDAYNGKELLLGGTSIPMWPSTEEVEGLFVCF